MPTGTILFTAMNDKGALYGFIVPDDGDGSRECNVWFDEQAAWAETLCKGDRVEYVPGKDRVGKGPTAERVTVIG